MKNSSDYVELRQPSRAFMRVRDIDYHVTHWQGTASTPIVMLHGWADVGASFQFVVDHLPAQFDVFAPDWRGFGRTAVTCDTFWFYDYLADLDALLTLRFGDKPVDLVGHSMGGNLASLYAGIRPERVRRLVNLEGAGMPPGEATEAPARLRRWLDELQEAPSASYSESLEAVAGRLKKNNPRLGAERADYLARQWSVRDKDGRFRVLVHPAHKIVNPYRYRADEVRAIWAEITAPVLWVFCEHMNPWHRFVESDEYAHRLSAINDLTRATVANAGHMLHHDQPEAVADLIESFLS